MFFSFTGHVFRDRPAAAWDTESERRDYTDSTVTGHPVRAELDGVWAQSWMQTRETTLGWRAVVDRSQHLPQKLYSTL